jgi:isopentenyl diphosphate isomerase/L-lactate dehydrogenase-like FMN-dependent dehydrogenase
VFGQLFREADSENIGVVTGEVAVTFFEKTRLDPRVLGEVSFISLEMSLFYKPDGQFAV